jgi:hypothetical protein
MILTCKHKRFFENTSFLEVDLLPISALIYKGYQIIVKHNEKYYNMNKQIQFNTMNHAYSTNLHEYQVFCRYKKIIN